ncbi:hypothetical protein AB0M54_37290 [Actinoplanes sp. NPDC051470]|uniref:hypothetical protein n=1 Tax=unclassified Actinoplanes TaxID=2626549 RepID=UPI003433DBC8
MRRLTAALVVLAFAVVGAVAGPAAPAQAACYGTAQAVTMYYGGNLIGQEAAQYASTCDGDGQYRGHVFDMYTDGSCVSVYFWNPGQVRQARSCDNAGTQYILNDNTGDTYAYWDMCTTYHCRYYTFNDGDDTFMYGY